MFRVLAFDSMSVLDEVDGSDIGVTRSIRSFVRSRSSIPDSDRSISRSRSEHIYTPPVSQVVVQVERVRTRIFSPSDILDRRSVSIQNADADLRFRVEELDSLITRCRSLYAPSVRVEGRGCGD